MKRPQSPSFAWTRRRFLRRSAALAVVSSSPAILRAAPALDRAQAAADGVDAELWRRFVDPYDLILDYTDLDGHYDRPTPEESRLGKPNALAWWTPVENAADFNGQYLDGAVARALSTRLETDRVHARRLAEGLLLLASVGEVPGFVARGVATDGRTPYAMGSNDQTAPWFYGLWRYAISGLPDAGLRTRIVEKMRTVADELARRDWDIPAAPPFHVRNSLRGWGWDDCPRLLFICRAVHQLTGDEAWLRRYRTLLHEREGDKGPTRVEVCSFGVEYRPRIRMWTGVNSITCLRGLWEMETDATLRAAYAKGLMASARYAVGVLPLHRKFDHDSTAVFEGDWRKLNRFWREQRTVEDALAVAQEQLAWKNAHSPRRVEEAGFVREPAYAAWMVTLCPEPAFITTHRDLLCATLTHYRPTRLRYSQFFPIDAAWWRLRAALSAG